MTSETTAAPGSATRFIDPLGRTWDVPVNVLTITRVRQALGFNLMEAVDPESDLFDRLTGDICLLVDTLYLACKDQADRLGLSDTQFGEMLDRDSIEDGTTALLQAIVNFSPRAVRPAFQKVLEKAKTVSRLEVERISQAMKDPEFERKLDAAMEEAIAQHRAPSAPT